MITIISSPFFVLSDYHSCSVTNPGCELFVLRDAINPSLGATLTPSRLQRPEKRTAHTLPFR